MIFRKAILSLSLTLALPSVAQQSGDAGTVPAHCATVAVFSLNDFHGAFVADARKDIPGAAAVWQTLDSLKAVYPYHVTVSAGDNFGGSYFYNATRGALMPYFFDGIGVRLSAVGNHEFDDGLDALSRKWADSPCRPSGWGVDYVCANVRGADGNPPAVFRPFATAEVQLPTRKLRVGFVGLLASSTPRQVSASRIRGLSFDGRYDRVLDSLAALPAFDAVRSSDIRLLLTHIGTEMRDGRPAWVDDDVPHLEAIADPLYHAVLSSHSHEAVCGRINGGLPVVQGHWHGNYISLMKFTVDTVAGRVVSVEPELCRVNPAVTLGEGPRRLQAKIDSCLEHTLVMGGVPLRQRLTEATAALYHDRSDKYRMSEVGTLVTRAYAEALRRTAGLKADEVIVGVSHFGSIRSGFLPGEVRVLDVGEVLPFDNALRVFRVSGRQLRELVEFGLHNRRYGWLQAGGLEMECDDAARLHVTRLYYTSPSGRRVRLKDSGLYYLVADEFVSNGGDGYPVEYFPAGAEVRVDGMPRATGAFVQYLGSRPTIGGEAGAEQKIIIGGHRYGSQAALDASAGE